MSFKTTVLLMSLCSALTAVSVLVAKGLIDLIAFATNLFYRFDLSRAEGAPDPSYLGWFSVLVPVAGGLIVGLMARFGSRAIRGHGIPEAMESILTRDSRIAKRITLLKPLSSAVAIGSGGPFGAEGPIIATGAALGSVMGQVIPLTVGHRKTLLAAGAAAGMTAIFGTPLAAVLLAIELLLFEFKATSFLPVATSAAFAAVLRVRWFGWDQPFFAVETLAEPGLESFVACAAFGLGLGALSVVLIRATYWIEDQFERLPIHWSWWPALGGLAVGLIGLIEPRTLGVGYANITEALSARLPLELATGLFIWKFLSWAIALGSGTSGGTLAPLMTLGATLGLLACAGLATIGLDLDPHLFALVGMAGLFAGCSRAPLASILFAFEATRQPLGLVPLIATCAAAHAASRTLYPHSIMTLKIARRGVTVPHEYAPPAMVPDLPTLPKAR